MIEPFLPIQMLKEILVLFPAEEVEVPDFCKKRTKAIKVRVEILRARSRNLFGNNESEGRDGAREERKEDREERQGNRVEGKEGRERGILAHRSSSKNDKCCSQVSHPAQLVLPIRGSPSRRLRTSSLWTSEERKVSFRARRTTAGRRVGKMVGRCDEQKSVGWISPF